MREAWRILRRWWFAVLPLVGLTIAVTVAVERAIPTEYQARSTISLLAAQSGARGSTGQPGYENPFLAFDSSITDTADLLTRRLDSSATAAHLRAMGVTGSYAVALAANAAGPFITLSVTGADPGQVTIWLHSLLDYAAQQLAAIQVQAAVPPASMIRSFVIIAPTEPTAQPARKIVPVLAVALAGLAFTVLLALLAEGVAVARRTRRGAATAEPETVSAACASSPDSDSEK